MRKKRNHMKGGERRENNSTEREEKRMEEKCSNGHPVLPSPRLNENRSE